jgi:exodeoxyribonuclease V beta subunit
VTLESIDLGRHAVIEASAGTGKTYTIENLVLRLLTETPARLENLLLVTFTEKATGELKARLRLTLERTARDNPERRPLLLAALDDFDQAPIFTIHGFCQRLLQEHALEQGQDFRAALVDDAELLPLALRDIQRKRWRAEFGDRLRDVLERSGFGRGTAEAWNQRVLEVAAKYQPRSDHQLRPAPAADWWKRLDEPGASWPGQLEVFTIGALREHLRDYKRQRGLQSFDDMIATVEESLDPARNADAPLFLARLRGRYRFGIVDEFQDTDPLQWRIFRRIFLEGGDSRLFVVGDPKQAIFGFRGADLPTYLKAATQMEEESGARRHDLQVNWRSAPELLEALNCVFLDGDWFPRETGIRYLEVAPPDEDRRQTRVVQDLTNRPALTVVDLRAWDRLKLAQKHYARFVAGEIDHLLGGSGGEAAFSFALKSGEPRPLEAGDICILIQKRAEADPVIEALKELEIPYSFYKQIGFWQSEEVLQLETVLRCLARPEEPASFRKALLTCFFRVRPGELVRCRELPADHAARRLFRRWLVCAESRQWSALFQSMLEDTGLLLQAMDDRAAESRVAKLRHLMGTLERVGHGENRHLLGLIEWIRAKRGQRDLGDGEQPPAEAERSRVRIMTIHASKGLEFPVVFLAGGFTARRLTGGATTYRDEAGRKVFDLCPDAEAQGLTAAEAQSEFRRLLYVALTRPMFKLYLPMVHLTSRSRAWAGPLGTILLPALKQACPDKLGALIAEVIAPPRPLAFPDSAEGAADTTDLPERPALAYSGPLFPAVDPHLEWRRIVVRSFSSMSRQHVAPVGAGASFGDQIRLAHDEASGPAERDNPLRGAAFGDIVHNVLEAIDFAEVGHCAEPAELLLQGAPARLLIDREVRANVANLRSRGDAEVEVAARQQVAQLVWTALHTPLAEMRGPLWQLPRADRLHELEFHFPEHPGDPVPADVRHEEGFLTGFMDLVFRAGGRYYLLDWKTNLLAGYTPEHLARCMDESDYHRQYRLYLHALYRWLGRVHGSSFSFARSFGGVYYLFVRGLNARDESTGVFFHRPRPEDIDLARALAR